ncbi:MAG: glycosyltransferase family 2 protein [Candidatus Levybacteria bacterium]|nr:glycosyltransferase family 2 protein [Candidatus Levybacteria bacterium]
MKFKDSVVTVILPVYNASKFLPECLASLKEQTYQDLQIIAIDDHSRDESLAILKTYKKQFKNLEIYSNKKRYGLAICYNRALKQAQGRFIAFMNPNDVNAISRFKRQVNFLVNNPKTVAVGTQFTSINENNKKLERSSLPENNGEIYNNLLPASPLHPETVMVDRMMLPKDLLYFKPKKYPLVFTEVFVKFFQYGQVANIAQSLYFHREGVKRHGRNQSRVQQFVSMMRVWLTSRANHEYRPRLRTSLPAMLKNA